SVAGGDGIKLSTDDYDDTEPSWSSDGSHLAYVASKRGEPCHIMVATVPAGGVREVGRCRRAVNSPLAWQPGPAFVYFTDAKVGGPNFGNIYRLNLDTGARDPIIPSERDNFFDLNFSKDGRSLLYRRSVANTGTHLVVVRDLASGREKILARMLAST